MRAMALQNAAIMFAMGLFLPGIDNWAHAGGFVGGYLTGMWLDPLKPERMDHMVMAAGCLVVTALAIVASVITAAMASFWA